jgi:hypothetical protein
MVKMKNGDEIDRENFNAIFGLLFFGVPHYGIRIEHWLPMTKGQPNEGLVRSLESESAYLRRLHEDFRAAFDFPDSEIVFLYETEPTRVAKVSTWHVFAFLCAHLSIGRGAWEVGSNRKLRNTCPVCFCNR